MAKPPAVPRNRMRLQRSHTFEGVEGPRQPEGGGNVSCFNGATPLRVWKAPPFAPWTPAPPSLQRSHTFEGVEGAMICWRAVMLRKCFNGATPLRVWKAPCRAIPAWRHPHRFNGATPLRVWKVKVE